MDNFYGKRLYRYYNLVPGRLEKDCLKPSSTDDDFIVQIHTEKGRYYSKFLSCETFYSWSKSVPEKEKTFSEVIDHSKKKQKFRMDIDSEVEEIDNLVGMIKIMLIGIGIKNPILMPFYIETSYHVVLINYIFASNIQCKRIAIYLSARLDQLGISINMDLGIYNTVQHFRLEGCTKYGERRWKRRMINIPLKDDNYHEGVICSDKKTEEIYTSFSHLVKNSKRRNKTERLTSTVMSPPPEYAIRWTDDKMIVLDRKYSSYCSQCERIHDKDGAFIINDILYCRRKMSFKA